MTPRIVARAVAATLLVALIALCGWAPSAEAQMIGSCWGVHPICIGPQQPVCLCDVMQHCWWACQ